MYDYKLRKSLEKDFFKLAKKNPKQLEIINKKIKEVIKNPEHYKNLRAPLNDWKSVHIGHFVLVFSVNKKLVIFEYYDHHDRIYL